MSDSETKILKGEDNSVDATARIVMIVGSPRRGGNCAALAEIAQKRAAESRIALEMFSVNDIVVQGCRGCMSCLSTAQCVLHDDMSELLASIEQASALVWITPVYFGTVPAQLKSVIDRFQVLWSRRQKGEAATYHTRRAGLLAIVGGGGDPFGAECVITPIRSVSNLAETTLRKPFVCIGPDEPRDIMHDEYLNVRQHFTDEVDELIAQAKRWSFDERHKEAT